MKDGILTRAALAGSLVVMACGPQSTEDEPTASDLAGIASDNVERALRGTHAAGSFVAESATLANSLGSVAGSSEDCISAPCINGVCPPAECVTEQETVTVQDLQQSRADLNESIDSLMKTLREKVFTKDNLESESDGTATYLLGPKAFCSSESIDTPTSGGSSGGSTSQPAQPQLDPDCVDQANRLQIRLRLSSPSDDNVNVALLLTASKLNPATLELHRDHVGVVADLGEIKAALDALGEDTGALSALTGKLGLELRRNAELDYSFRANVLEDVTVSVRDDLGVDAHYGVGHSVPTFELRLDGNARQVTGTVDVGAVTVDGPLDAYADLFDPEQVDALGEPIPRPHYQGTVAALLAGLEAGVTLDGSTDKLTLNHLGLGDQASTIKVDQDTIATFNLNPAAGRHFDLMLEKQGTETLGTLVPTLDAELLLKLAPLASQIADLSPALLDNTIHLWFDGENPSVATGNDELRVVSGTLNYTESYAPAHNLSAPAGSCVATADSSTDDGVSNLAVVACQ